MPTNTQQFRSVRDGIKFTVKDIAGGVRFANSAAPGATSTGGYNWSNPNTTLIGAQSICTATAGDAVAVYPEHAETITGAAGMTFSVDGVSYLGYGNDRQRPVITFNTATAAQMIVSGNAIKFSNMIFDFSGFDAIVAAISVTGYGVAFEDCEFILNSATTGVVKGILVSSTGVRFRCERCRFIGVATTTGTTTTAAIDVEGVDYLIKDCYITGKMTQAILNTATTLRGEVINNVIQVNTGTSAMTFAAASTPTWANNRMNVASGTTPVTAAAGFNGGGNYYSAAVGVAAATLC